MFLPNKICEKAKNKMEGQKVLSIKNGQMKREKGEHKQNNNIFQVEKLYSLQ